ncbi:MAG: hypothetical protein K0M40_20430 [Prolixibacteraceae bacterium]|nr:hypothetical protein [Prolixibacteraceae bacterium]
MTTVVINEKTKEGELLLEFLRTQDYVTITEKTPSPSLIRSMNEAKTGKVIRVKNVHDLLSKLKE